MSLDYEKIGVKSADEIRALTAFIDALREMRRSYERFSKAVPSIPEAHERYKRAIEECIRCLGNKDLEAALDRSIAEVMSMPDEDRLIYSSLDTDARRHVIKTESSIASKLGISGSRAEKEILKLEKQGFDVKDAPKNTEELKQALYKLYESSVEDLISARNHSGKEKRAHKKNVQRGVFSGLFGASVLAGDLVFPAMLPYSIAISGTSFLFAGRDMIGE